MLHTFCFEGAPKIKINASDCTEKKISKPRKYLNQNSSPSQIERSRVAPKTKRNLHS